MVSYQSGRHFLQIPGPTNVPDRVLRALSAPTIDHRGPEFSGLALEVLDGVKRVFQTAGSVLIYPSSGTGAWEAALANTLSPGDKVLMYETGHFATLWRNMAVKLGLQPEFIASDWRGAIDAAKHPTLLMVDTISSLGSIDYRHDEWGVDVTVAGSQKGLMLPPGISFNAVSEKAIAASKHAKLPRAFWDWA